MVVGRVIETVLTATPTALFVTVVFAVIILGLAVAVTLSVSTVRPSKQEHAEEIDTGGLPGGKNIVEKISDLFFLGAAMTVIVLVAETVMTSYSVDVTAVERVS
jgi:uncharacterized membrane protein YdcZ (DUF606 family)